jgi:predicted DNA-binding transcriptional regulator YafY
VADSVPVLDLEPTDDGGAIVTLAVGGPAWFERLLLQAGPQARVLQPADWADIGVEAARRVLSLYAER